MRRHPVAGQLIDLQPGIVGMADHQLHLVGLARRKRRYLLDLHLAHAGHGDLMVLKRRRRTSAGSLHEPRRHIERAVVHLGDRAHIGVFVHPDTGRDRRNAALRRQAKHAGDGGGVLVDQEMDGLDVAIIGLRDIRRHLDRHHSRIFGSLRRIQTDDAGAVGNLSIIEKMRSNIRPGIIVVGHGRQRGQRQQKRHGQGQKSCLIEMSKPKPAHHRPSLSPKRRTALGMAALRTQSSLIREKSQENRHFQCASSIRRSGVIAASSLLALKSSVLEQLRAKETQN